MDKYGIVKCNTCAAPMYADFAKGGFLCQYCGTFYSWGDTLPEGQSHFAPQHERPKMVDGCFDISDFCPSVREIDRKMPEQKYTNFDYWQMTTLQKERVYDATAYEKWENRELITTQCPNCTAPISGFSTQNLFECKYCGSTMPMDFLVGKEVEKELIVGNDEIPAFALPFQYTHDEAKASIIKLLDENQDAFKKDDVMQRLENLQTLFLPYEISDVNSFLKLDNDCGIIFFFQEIVNHATPLSFLYNRVLLANLQPWDFEATVPFRPSFLEDDVHLVGLETNVTEEIQGVRMAMQFGQLNNFMKSEPDMYDTSRVHWIREKVKSSLQLMLPVYYLSENETEGSVFAVNGQTGVACAHFGPSYAKVNVRTMPIVEKKPLSDEVSLISSFIPVAKMPGNQNLVRPTSLREALIVHPNDELKRRKKLYKERMKNRKKYNPNFIAERQKILEETPRD